MTTVAEADKLTGDFELDVWDLEGVRERVERLAKFCDSQADAPLRSNVHVSRMEWRDLADQLWKVVGE